MQRSTELYGALVAVLLATVVYLYVTLTQSAVPRAGGLVGHSLGLLGFLLMLSTETLYSIRKRGYGLTWGRTSTWLQIHIFTGLFGSYLVLLHSSWKLNGLAGAVMLLTIVIVASGFVGRYIYTAIPRTVEGPEPDLRDLGEQIAAASSQLEAQVAAANGQLEAWTADQSSAVSTLANRLAAEPEPTASSAVGMVLGRVLPRWQRRRQLRRELRQLDATGHQQAVELQQLLDRQYRLRAQTRSLAAARRWLALWRVTHEPLGVVLFILAFVHIGGALYYVTFSR